MPNYSRLRPWKHDSPERLIIKQKICADILRLREALAEHIQSHRVPDAHRHGSVRIATWNLRDFGKGMRGRRLDEAIYCIAEIISFFDIVALQEISRGLDEFRRLLDVLGPDWEFVMTDASPSGRGNDERMVFLYNRNRARWKRVAGELVLAGEHRLMLPNSFDLTPAEGVLIDLPAGGVIEQVTKKIKTKTTSKGTRLDEEVVFSLPAGASMRLPQGAELVFKGFAGDLKADETIDLKSGARRQFSTGSAVRLPPADMVAEDLGLARTPFLVQFQAGWLRLSLSTVHIFFGDDVDTGLKMLRRQEEIRALTRMLAGKAADEKDDDADNYFILLGDFNIKTRSHGTMEALEDNGFEVPEAIRQLPHGSNVARDKFYDQMAVWQGQTRRRQFFKDYTSVQVLGAGVFDFYKHVFRQGMDDPDGEEEAYYLKRMAEENSGKVWRYRDWRTYHMSDHLPMWIELRTDFADDYLKNVQKAHLPEPTG